MEGQGEIGNGYDDGETRNECRRMRWKRGPKKRWGRTRRGRTTVVRETFQAIDRTDANARIIERATHYPVIRPTASGIIGNSLLCLDGAVFNEILNESTAFRRWQCANRVTDGNSKGIEPYWLAGRLIRRWSATIRVASGVSTRNLLAVVPE